MDYEKSVDEENNEANKDHEIIQEPSKYVEPEERITPCYLTKYEKAWIIGARAVQISRNCPVLIPLGKEDFDPVKIAEKELEQKKIPFVIRRYLPDGAFEDWKVSELQIIDRF